MLKQGSKDVRVRKKRTFAIKASTLNSPCGPSFWAEVQRLSCQKGIERDKLFKIARLDASICCFAWPQRDVVLRLCLALQLDAHVSQRLLALSGNAVLAGKLLRDAAILFALDKHWGLAKTQVFLRKLNSPLLYP